MPEQDQLDDELVLERVRDVSAGQFSYPFPTDDIVIPPNAAAELLDMDIDQVGRRSKRRGYTMRADDVGAAMIAGLAAVDFAGGNYRLVMESNGVIYDWDGAAASWTSRQTGLTVPSDWSEFAVGAVNAVTRIFRLGQTDQIYSSTDAATWAAEGDTNTNFPKAKLAIWTSIQRMLAANTTGEPNGLFWSNSGNPQIWDRATNLLRIGKSDKRGITGVIEFTDLNVMAWTLDEMHFVDISNATPSNWTRTKVADIGCVAPRTVRLIGEDGLFLSRDGVRSVIQSAQDKKRAASHPLTYPIQDWIDRINWANAHKAVAWVWTDKYYLAVPIDSSTTNSHTLVWSRRAFEANDRNGGWSVYRNWAMNAYATQGFGTTPRFYGGEASADSKVYELRSADPTQDAKTDNGTAITMRETGRRLDHDTPEFDKSYQSIEVEALAQDTGTLTIEAAVDGGGYTTIGTLSLISGAPTLPITLPFTLVASTLVRGKFNLGGLGRGRDIQVRLIESTSGNETVVLGYAVAAFVEKYEAG